MDLLFGTAGVLALSALGMSIAAAILKISLSTRARVEEQADEARLRLEEVRLRSEEDRREFREFMARLERDTTASIARLSVTVARRELDFLADRVVALERSAPLAIRCNPAETADGELRCPYCHDELGAAATTRCSRCEARHHAECYTDHGRCAVFGCGQPPEKGVVRVE